jgi:DNA polymerase-3 subunit gamma/tau
MGQALYRKYRSRSFSEVVGQEHITKTLGAAIKSGRISHAYLFTGPRGVGKTSVARILAHAVNDLPYESESIHLDIIEIDAASNRRIDEIRDLRDKVHISPTSAKYKVYIIDEVHMLTREAFNALLKTLEEPPAHVIFILATTEAHKLPETIISRTQRHNFKAVSPAVAAAHLADIAKHEKINIDEPSLRLLAQFGDGSFRDSIGLLDQLAAGGVKIDEKLVRQHLGLPSDSVVDGLLKAVDSSDAKQILSLLNEQREQATDPTAMAKALSERLRTAMLEGQPAKISLLKSLLEVPASPKPFDRLELALLEAIEDSPAKPIVKASQAAEPLTTKVEAEPELSVAEDVPKKSANFDLSSWPDVLAEVKSHTPALYTALRLASPSIEDDKVVLVFEFSLHQKKMNQAKNKETVAQAIEAVSGKKIGLECIVDKSSAKPEPIAYEPAEAPAASNPLQSISNIFGSAEVLES